MRLFWVSAPHVYTHWEDDYPCLISISERIKCGKGELHLKIEHRSPHSRLESKFEVEITLYLTEPDKDSREVDSTYIDASEGQEGFQAKAEELLYSHIDSNGNYISNR